MKNSPCMTSDCCRARVCSDVVVVLKDDKRWSKTDFHLNRQVEGALLSRPEQVIRCVLITGNIKGVLVV